MKRMGLGWGGGSFNVLINLASDQFLMSYSSVAAAKWVHETHGGQNYYCSRSGLSGAGWIPGHMALRSVSTYRVDSAYVEAPQLASVPDVLPGVAVIVPIDYRSGQVANDWPILVYEKRVGKLYLLDSYGVRQMLNGQDEMFEDRDFPIRYIPSVSGEETERVFKVGVRKGINFNYRRALIGLFNAELQFDWGDLRTETGRFWTRLGLRQSGNQFFKIAQNVCRARYTREELSTVEGLQAAAPANVLVLTPTLYIQESGNFQAVGLFNIDAEEVEFEIELETAEAVKAMAGDFAVIVARLEEGAREKVAQMLEARRQQEQWSAELLERDSKFRELCEQHADLEITVADSIAAGNCSPGTEDFRTKHFATRESVTVKDLMRFVSVSGVRRVLEYKLLPFAQK